MEFPDLALMARPMQRIWTAFKIMTPDRKSSVSPPFSLYKGHALICEARNAPEQSFCSKPRCCLLEYVQAIYRLFIFSKSFKFRGESSFPPVFVKLAALNRPLFVHETCVCPGAAAPLGSMCLVTRTLSWTDPVVPAWLKHRTPVPPTPRQTVSGGPHRPAGPGPGPRGKEAGAPGTLRRLWRSVGGILPISQWGADRTSPSCQSMHFQPLLQGSDTPQWQRLPSASPTLQRRCCHRTDQAASGLTAAEVGWSVRPAAGDGRKGGPGRPERVASGTLCPGLGHKCRFPRGFTGCPCAEGR